MTRQQRVATTSDRPGVAGAQGQIVVRTPSSWWHLDVADDRPDIAARFINGLSESDGDPAKQKLAAEITATLDTSIHAARQQGVAMVAIWARPVHGRLVGASMTVAVAPLGTAVDRLQEATTDMPTLLTRMEAALRRRSGSRVVTSMVATGVGPAVRATSTTIASAMGGEHQTRVVQYLVPVPQDLSMLVLTLSTPTVVLADALDRLFDGIAARLRWERSAAQEDQAAG